MVKVMEDVLYDKCSQLLELSETGSFITAFSDVIGRRKLKNLAENHPLCSYAFEVESGPP
jgi:hypothetical protein